MFPFISANIRSTEGFNIRKLVMHSAHPTGSLTTILVSMRLRSIITAPQVIYMNYLCEQNYCVNVDSDAKLLSCNNGKNGSLHESLLSNGTRKYGSLPAASEKEIVQHKLPSHLNLAVSF